jgi:hypothetical protein
MFVVDLGLFLNVDEESDTMNLITITIPSPNQPLGFILVTSLFGIVLAYQMVIPKRILSLGNLVQKDPYGIAYPFLSKMGNLTMMLGSLPFIFFFYSEIFDGTKSYDGIYGFTFFFTILVGLPIAIFCLFYVYNIENKIKPKILSYLRNELKIKPFVPEF